MEKDLQLVPAPAPAAAKSGQPPPPQQLTLSTAGAAMDGAIVEYTAKSGPLLREEEEDLEVKLRRIIDNVPVRVSNTSGSSAGAGSGDFHQAAASEYRQMRRKEQDRLARMDVDYQRRKELAEFNMRREERLKAAEERTTKKRLKRQKRKQRKKERKNKPNDAGEERVKEESSADDHSDDGEE